MLYSKNFLNCRALKNQKQKSSEKQQVKKYNKKSREQKGKKKLKIKQMMTAIKKI